MTALRIGHGYDAHRLVRERDLILCGVHISHTLGLDGHSDADVAAHAVMDALLGAAGLLDIGAHFPSGDEKYKNADSMELLKTVVSILSVKNYNINNIDVTIIAQSPKLNPFIPEMRSRLAEICGLDIDAVNVKATTEEYMGFTGREEGISAHAVCLIDKINCL